MERRFHSLHWPGLRWKSGKDAFYKKLKANDVRGIGLRMVIAHY